MPATGAKGLNLAVADVFVLTRALSEWYRTGSSHLLEAYTDTCLRRVWRPRTFSDYLRATLHRYPGDDVFRDRLQLARLETLTVSAPAAEALAVNYVGLPLPEAGDSSIAASAAWAAAKAAFPAGTPA